MLESFFGFFFLAKNYSCHFWHFPIIFASHSILSFLYSVLKVPVGIAQASSKITSSLFTLHYSLQAKPAVVGSNGLEPSTSRLSGVRSNQLSYRPVKIMERVMGIEPTTTAWKAVVLPLNYTRVKFYMGRLMGIEPTNVGATIRCVNHFAIAAIINKYGTI